MVKYCIKELFYNLHVDAGKNIVFCCTQSRGSSFGPGDTIPTLKRILQEAKISDNVDLNKDTVFYVDNETVRYLAMVKKNISIKERDKLYIADSWERSKEEMKRLVESISTLKPHVVKNTTSLNE